MGCWLIQRVTDRSVPISWNRMLASRWMPSSSVAACRSVAIVRSPLVALAATEDHLTCLLDQRVPLVARSPRFAATPEDVRDGLARAVEPRAPIPPRGDEGRLVVLPRQLAAPRVA